MASTLLAESMMNKYDHNMAFHYITSSSWSNPEKQQTKKVKKMDKKIIELYPKTADAVLIDNYFRDKFQDKTFSILLEGKEGELLDLAKELQFNAHERYLKENKHQ